MQKWLKDLLISLFESPSFQAQLTAWKEEFFAFLKTEFDAHKAEIMAEIKSWLPIIIKAVAVAMARSAGQVVVNTTDKVTDIIPGHVDDSIIDPIVRDTMGAIGDLIHIDLR